MCDLNQKLKDFKIEEMLGRGAFGIVKKAIYLPENKIVAIKLINKKKVIELKMVNKIIDEAGLHYRLCHPSILKLYDFFEDDENVYLVLEYCRHGDLRRYLRKHDRIKLSESEASTIVKQVLDGLLYLHGHGILHRDLKLENLLLDDHFCVKIADFGLAAKLSHPAEMHMTMCGTPNYISPEVAKEIPHGVGVDVWGLGVLLHQLLFGRGPFQGESIKSTLSKVVSEEVVIAEGISWEAKDLLEKMLDKVPERRITATNAAAHPFFKMYPDTPLFCGVTQDSGIGHCSMCNKCDIGGRSLSRPLSTLSRRGESSHCTRISNKSHNSMKIAEIAGDNHLFKCYPSISYVRSGSRDTSHCSQNNGDRFSHSRTLSSQEMLYVKDKVIHLSVLKYICTFTTARLAPTRLVMRDLTYYILASGEAVLEKPKEPDLSIYWVVTKDGCMAKFVFPRPYKMKTPPPIPPDATKYDVKHLPQHLHDAYIALADFVRSVQATTIKITTFTRLGTCRLMESSPDNFVMNFISGDAVEKNRDIVTVTLSSGVCQKYNYASLLQAHDPPLIIQLFIKEFKKCLKLERFLSENSTDDDLFPANFGGRQRKGKVFSFSVNDSFSLLRRVHTVPYSRINHCERDYTHSVEQTESNPAKFQMSSIPFAGTPIPDRSTCSRR